MTVKISYDTKTFFISGYYPDNINYTNNTDYQQIIKDGNYTEVSEEEYLLFLQDGKQRKYNTKKKQFVIYEISEEELLQSKKTSTIQQTKSKASKRITLKYPLYKQTNIQSAYLSDPTEENLTKLNECNSFITNIRSKSNLIEADINKCTSLEELNSIDISSDSLWQ